ncbi:MAG: YifB family Mg chelatase-like AAA ATPase [Dorea sp.]|nr:YifB family Mg chelatase-like AAA ATPase [Dorea sp.]
MSFYSVKSASVSGLLVDMIQVEADVSNGLPVFHMVGYLSSEVKEASDRVRTAIRNTGLHLPARHIVVNLSPGDQKKKGTSFDLPIALSVLISSGVLPPMELDDTLIMGELGLDGSLKAVPGILPAVLKAKEEGCVRCILPKGNVKEAMLVDGIEVFGISNLSEICEFLLGEIDLDSSLGSYEDYADVALEKQLDFAEIHGQSAVKRAAEVAVSGGHNLLFIGPPGSGKSMVAQRIPSILPAMTMEESMEVTKIYSIMGMVDEEHPLFTRRPFRSVHHTITKAGLVGGGSIPNPGEISLAHNGVLFLDELTEFQKPVLEVLRQPLEEKKILISRNQGTYQFPANFMLIAAMNPCPCGNYPDARCNCTSLQINRYLGKVSQPFLDRIDICIEAPKIDYHALTCQENEESSETIRKRVERAREIQKERYRSEGISTNSLLNVKQIEKYCRLGREETALMKKAFATYSLTARTYHKILKVARTIADLDESEKIQLVHLKEAIGYRSIDQKYWGGAVS